jgi:hypothetical protein
VQGTEFQAREDPCQKLRFGQLGDSQW